ncbi:hypothetical protein PROPEN_02163 [Proteus penneri ATCC 35198]|nr:hypothetical protein PROPEN_02163 [Proteus penneri ATCC 35198]
MHYFFSFDGEIDTSPLISQLWALNKQICLPVLHPFHRHHLLFFALHTFYCISQKSL